MVDSIIGAVFTCSLSMLFPSGPSETSQHNFELNRDELFICLCDRQAERHCLHLESQLIISSEHKSD